MTILMSHNARRNGRAASRQADPHDADSRQLESRDADRHEADAEAEALRREMPLVPAASIPARAPVTVIAILTLVASLSARPLVLISAASRGWQSSASQDAAIQA